MAIISLSRTPAKTKIMRVTLVGPKGGHHHVNMVFKLKHDEGVMVHDPRKTERGQRILLQKRADGWFHRVVEWYNSARKQNTHGEPSGYLLYRLHKNDVYNHPGVKPGWKIVGD